MKITIFSEKVLDELTPSEWWKVFINDKNRESSDIIQKLLTAVASSAGVERVFSTYGLVHSKLRNRLGKSKAAKLVKIFKAFN